LVTQTEIIDGCKAGIEKYQSRLYAMYSGKMFALCIYYSKNRSEAEDILHDGFIKVFQNISQLRDYSLLDFWIRKIFVNCALAKYRKQNLLHFELNLPETVVPLYYDDVIDQMSAQEISSLIQTLSPQYRIVFNLYAIEGYSHKEIADILHISESTSKSNLSRARVIMQEKIEKEHTFYRSNVALQK
jgi:RNA polymerase sigma-70 factor (ECF subfamily)